ncbi:MAG: pyridoxal-dependent decarboxylase [Gemmatimonadetes bacterium]|nr:pyridoxal-dependent decarboxylase [Gemmatimonadota bacterium]
MHTNTDRPAAALTPQIHGLLDPDDWDELRQLGHRMVDDVMSDLSTVRDRPAWRPVPEDVRAAFRTPAPETGVGPAQAYDDFRDLVLPYPLGNTHPRFWGWVIGTGTPYGALAEMLAAAFNPNVSGLRTAAVHVEEQVIAWMKELLHFDEKAEGLLLSGGSMANTLGLAVAVQARAEFDVARLGLSRAPHPMVLYASRETHYSVHKAVRLLGLGDESLRLLPVDDQFRLEIPKLEAAIAADRDQGYHPFAVVANAGTVNTGAVDDLATIADVAERENLWMHVDGAFGAFAALDPSVRHLVDGMERADSLAFDLHKWMCVPIECGCLFVRDAESHRRAFTIQADYLTPLPRGTAVDGGRFGNLGPQLSRSFRALKVWLSIKAHGSEAYAAVVRRNVAQAAYLSKLVDVCDELERLAPTLLNVVCFRYVVSGWTDADLDELNREITMRVQEEGIAVPSHTVLEGRFAIRVAITNHRTREDDLDLFVAEVRRIARDLVQRGVIRPSHSGTKPCLQDSGE